MLQLITSTATGLGVGWVRTAVPALGVVGRDNPRFTSSWTRRRLGADAGVAGTTPRDVRGPAVARNEVKPPFGLEDVYPGIHSVFLMPNPLRLVYPMAWRSYLAAPKKPRNSPQRFTVRRWYSNLPQGPWGFA